MHPKVLPQLQRRAAAITDGPIDWGTGEILAFGSLLMEGRPVRLAGQDSRRGTFVSALRDDHRPQQRRRVDAAAATSPRTRRSSTSTTRCSRSTPRSGFEYGYSVARPEALVLWEAQFGDFVNGAQTVIDEFISSGETKWRQQSGVVLLLPHGYEGQGPDHSSARIERFLHDGADDAFVVAQPSTPASYFHLLRQHSLGEEHRPLIVFTPKSMLKRKEAASQPDDFTDGHVPAGDRRRRRRRRRGRHAAALLGPDHLGPDGRARQARGRPARVAIARLEQLYPRPVDEISEEIAQYPNLKEIRWVQDEPANMGPWPHYAAQPWPELGDEVGIRIEPVSRDASASPSVGAAKRHQEEQKDLLDRAFAAWTRGRGTEQY